MGLLGVGILSLLLSSTLGLSETIKPCAEKYPALTIPYADYEARDKKNQALAEATFNSDFACALRIIRAGADPNAYVYLTLPSGTQIQMVPLKHVLLNEGREIIQMYLENKGNLKVNDWSFIPLLLPKFQQNPELLSLLLKHGADPNQPPSNYYQASPLMTALINGRIDAAITLIEAGSKLDAKKSYFYLGSQRSELELALALGNPELTAAIIDHGISPNKLDERGKRYFLTALASLPDSKIEKVLDLLLKKGFLLTEQPKEEPVILQSLDLGNVKLTKALVARGSDLRAVNKKGETALDAALMSANLETLEWTLGQGFKWSDKSVQDSALINALSKGKYDFANYLLSHGVTIKGKDLAYNNLLVKAINKDDEKLYKYLLDHGIDVNTTSDDFGSPLIAAAWNCDPKLMKLLHSKGGKLGPGQISYDLFSTAVERACDTEFVNLLVELGADLNSKFGGTSSIGILLSRLRPEAAIAKKWLTRITDVNYVDSDGRSILSYAAMSCDPKAIEVIDYLLKRGADLKKRSKWGNYAAEVACDPKVKSRLAALGGALAPGLNSKPINIDLEYTNLAVWNRWAKVNQEVKAPKENATIRIVPHYIVDSLISNFLVNKKALPPPKDAPTEVVETYNALSKAINRPWDLSIQDLDLNADYIPPHFYRVILTAARSPAANASGKFKANKEATLKVVTALLSSPDSSVADLESAAWLIGRSGLPVDESLVNAIKIEPKKLKADVETMLKLEPLKYRGASDLAAIKITKAILAYSNDELACGLKGNTINPAAGETLMWFATYANNPEADRGLFARLARLILEKKSLCPQDRNLLLSAMKDWRVTHASAQHEVACAVSANFALKPMAERTFDEIFIISRAVGLRSDLSQSSWIEQIKAFGDISADIPTEYDATGANPDIADGLLKYVLGNPPGRIVGAPKADPKAPPTELKIPATDPKPGSIVSLCQILNTERANPSPSSDSKSLIRGADRWLNTLKEDLLNPRTWPKGFEPTAASTTKTSTTLAEDFVAAGMSGDLEAVKSNCTSVTATKKTTAATAPQKPVSAAPAPKKSKKSGDFDPWNKMKKKKH